MDTFGTEFFRCFVVDLKKDISTHAGSSSAQADGWVFGFGNDFCLRVPVSNDGPGSLNPRSRGEGPRYGLAGDRALGLLYGAGAVDQRRASILTHKNKRNNALSGDFPCF